MGVFIMRKNQLITIMSSLSLLGGKTIALSIGALSLSLGMNLSQLDNNNAVAGVTFENETTGTCGTASDSIVGAGAGVPIIFASELFGSSTASVTLPETKKMAVTYTFDGAIDAKFKARFTLTGASFDTAELGSVMAPTIDALTPSTIGGSNYVEAVINAAEASAVAQGDTITLCYSIRSADVLKVSGQKVTMGVTLMTPQPSYSVSPARDVDIAESAAALSVSLATDTDLDDRISVASGNTEFVETTATNKATIGSLTITSNYDATDNDIVGQDGETPFITGHGDAIVNADNTTLTITDGQFKASVNTPGAVNLQPSATTALTKIYVQATDETTAVFHLTSDNFKNLQGGIGADGEVTETDNTFTIDIIADGKTDINVNENPPVASLAIEYDDDNYAKMEYPAVELKKIKQDGTRCVIYNVPAPGSADIVAVRITNDSGVDGVVSATLYDGSGAEIFAAQPLNGGNVIAKKATLAIFAEDLAKLGTWTGRGVLVLTTTLPKLEVLGLLREANNNAAPLTNLSTGAMGDGCTN
jgi:hypothetical protein